MEIVVEYVLIENCLINLLVLKTVALLTKEKGRLCWLASLLGACLTVAMPIFRLTEIGYFLVEIGVVVLGCCLCFKFKTIKKFVRLFGCYFIVLFLYGGACFFVERLFGITSVLIVLAVVVAVYFVVKLLMKKYVRKQSIDSFCFDVEIEEKGKKTNWKGFLDSGNLLYDPLTEMPVCLINFKVFTAIFSEIDLQDVLTKSVKMKKLQLAHYINFNTLNQEDKILVFQVDKIKIGEKISEKPILGLSLKNFNEAFESDIILHNNFANLGC